MRLALAAMLIGYVALSTVQLAAQAATESTTGPIGQAIERQAVRFRVDPETGLVDSQWSRVGRLPPGTEIILTTQQGPPDVRYVVRADESGLIVLKLADPSRLAAAGALLRAVAADHPDYFSAAQHGGSFLFEGNVRFGPDGVFVDARKVADLGEVVTNIARTDVVEIRTLKKGRGVWGHLGALGGFFVGAMSGGLVAGFACQAAAGRERCDTGAFLTGALVGGIAGGGFGFRAANRETEDVVYRARERQLAFRP